MPTSPPAADPRGGARSARRRTAAVRPARCPLRLALGLMGVGGLLLSGPGVRADEDALPTTPPGPAPVAETPAKPDPIGEKLAGIFAGIDQGIRSLTTATDRAASRALEVGLGALADGHDRRMSDQARTALAGSPAAAQRHFEVASVDAPPPSIVRAVVRPAPTDGTGLDDPVAPAAPSPAPPTAPPAARSAR